MRIVGRHAGEDRRAEELPLEPLAAGDELRAAVERVGDVALDLLERGLVDQRPHLDAVGEPVRDDELADRVGESLEERVVDPGLDEHPVRRDARLARVAELADERRRDRDVEVGVVEDDERRVPAELERDLLHLVRALRASAASRPPSSP